MTYRMWDKKQQELLEYIIGSQCFQNFGSLDMLKVDEDVGLQDCDLVLQTNDGREAFIKFLPDIDSMELFCEGNSVCVGDKTILEWCKENKIKPTIKDDDFIWNKNECGVDLEAVLECLDFEETMDEMMCKAEETEENRKYSNKHGCNLDVSWDYQVGGKWDFDFNDGEEYIGTVVVDNVNGDYVCTMSSESANALRELVKRTENALQNKKGVKLK